MFDSDRTAVIEPAETPVYSGVLDGHAVLFSSRDRRFHVLNETAQAIWTRLGVGRTIGGLTADLADHYGVAPHEIANDVETLVAQLRSSGLCRLSTDPTATDDALSAAAPPVVAQRSTQRINRSTIGPIEALGAPFTVEVDDELLRVEVARVLDPLRRRDGSQRPSTVRAPHQHLSVTAMGGRWVIRCNDAKLATVPSRSDVLRTIVAHCNSGALPFIDDALVLHAAGVELGGQLVVFPGVSNAGKSTLAAQLMLRGHAYLTDEAVAIDLESLGALPYTKSLTLEPGAQPILPDLVPSQPAGDSPVSHDVDPRTIGAGRLSEGGPVTAIVFPTFDATRPGRLEPLMAIDAMRRLLANTFEFAHIGQAAFDALIRIADGLPCYSLDHQGGPEHLDQLEMMFDTRSAISL